MKVIRPRPVRAQEAPVADPASEWRARTRDASGGVTLGAAAAALVCIVLSLLVPDLFGSAHMVAIYTAMVVTGALAGGAAALLIQWRYRELAAIAHPRVRRSARGWAVVVHARDIEQRALAARALARAARPQGPVAA